MKKTSGILFVFALMFSSVCFSGTLVLSYKLQVDYPEPLLISLSGESLIFKYKDWSFLYDTVNPKTIYQSVDLTGVEKKFIRSFFDTKIRSQLPEWLAALSKEQVKVFGITPANIKKTKVGPIDIIGYYDEKDRSGHFYVFEELATRHFAIYGTKNNF
ncbi:MAG TPA: hypothetical protein ENI94_09495, partial [Gammaproteobacteria bacterium]|nr:hypothetical protein [Gammaproteobacteria bacterium]